MTEESNEKPKEPYYVQYKLADNFFQFYFRFIERNQGHSRPPAASMRSVRRYR